MAVHRFEGGGEAPIEVRVEGAGAATTVHVDDASFAVEVLGDPADGVLRLAADPDGAAGDPAAPARLARLHAVDAGDHVAVWWRGRAWRLPVVERKARRAGDPAAGAASDEVTAPMPGTVLAVKVAAGDAVAKDAVVVVMESMKMEMSLPAARDATVAEVLVAEGDMVELGRPLVRFAPADAAADPAGTDPGHRGSGGG